MHERLSLEQKPQQRRKRKYIIYFFVAFLILSISSVATYIFVISDKQIDIPSDIRNVAPFNIVEPKKLPKDYKVNGLPKYISAKKSLITEFERGAGGRITLTQQEKPKSIDLDQIDARENYLVNIGNVYILKGETGKLQSIIETDDSWVYVTANKEVTNSVYKTFISNLAN